MSATCAPPPEHAHHEYPDDDWQECETCGGTGEGEHDCGEDCCCCLDPEPGICWLCDGKGGWRYVGPAIPPASEPT